MREEGMKKEEGRGRVIEEGVGVREERWSDGGGEG